MRLPIRHLSGNVLWTYGNAVWAIWRVSPVTYPYLTTAQKINEYQRVRQGLIGLGRAEVMLLSVCAPVPPEAVVSRMAAGVQYQPEWQAVTDATLEELRRMPLSERRYYIAVRLSDTGNPLLSAFGAAAAGVGASFGLSPPPVTAQEADTRHRQAGEIRQKLAGHIPVTAVPPDEILWLYARAPRRGVDDLRLEEFTERTRWWERKVGDGADTVLRGPSLASYDNYILHEGGVRTKKRGHELRRRYLGVDIDLYGQPTLGHQAFLIFSALPEQFSLPGNEWFAAADLVPFPVDWCARLRTVDNRVAQKRARRQARELAAQVEEYAQDAAGPPGGLGRAYENVTVQANALEANRNEHELEASIIYSVWHQDPDECQSRAEQLRLTLSLDEFSLDRPTGGQRGLYQAMLPGSEIPQVCRDYVQNLLPSAMAGSVPFASADIGDPGGMLLGYSMDVGTARPVLLDPAYGPTVLNRSGNMLFQGTLGGGKSYSMKRVGSDVLSRGGRLVIVDRTPRGEWVAFAQAVASNPAIVRLEDGGSGFSLDPLRVFPKHLAVRYAAGYLALLTGARPRELDGLTLKQAVEATQARGGRLRDVISLLGSADGLTSAEEAEQLAAKLSFLSRDPYAELAFGDAPPLSIRDSDLVVFHCPGLTLPDQTSLSSDYQRAHLSDEQVHSQALLYLVAAVSRQIAFSDLTRYTAVMLDEAWVLARSPEGYALLEEMLRDSRKHLAGLLLASQSIETVPPELLALVSIWWVFRQERGSGLRSLTALGIEAEEWLLDTVAEFQTGEALYHDVRGRVGRVRIAEAALEAHRLAFDTTPSGAPRRLQPAPAAPVGPELPVDADGAGEGRVPDDLAAMLPGGRR